MAVLLFWWFALILMDALLVEIGEEIGCRPLRQRGRKRMKPCDHGSRRGAETFRDEGKGRT